MRVAICFSGAIRSFMSCYPSIYRSIIQPLNPDIFMHMWNFGEDLSVHKNNDNYITYHKLQNDECSTEYMVNLVKPKKYVVEKYSDTWEKRIIELGGGEEIFKDLNQHDIDYAMSALGMYFKIDQCNKLKQQYEKEHGFKYDVVIRARGDFFWYDNFCKKDFEGLTDTDILLQKDSYCVKARWPGNDKFFAATSETMDKFCNLFSEIGEYHKNRVCMIEGQNLFKHHVIKLDLDIRWLGDQYTYLKFQSRHRTTVRENTVYFVDYTLDPFVGYHLAEKLLECGFQVHGYTGRPDGILTLINKDVLTKYPHFTDLKDKPDEEHIKKYGRFIVFNDSGYLDSVETDNKIHIITAEPNSHCLKPVKNVFHVTPCFGPRQNSMVELGPSTDLLYVGDVVEFMFHKIYDKKATGSHNIVAVHTENLGKKIENTNRWIKFVTGIFDS